MSIQSRIQKLKTLQSQAFDVQNLIQKLKSVRVLSQAQISANRSLIQQGLRSAIPIIAKTIQDNSKQIKPGQHQNLSRQLMAFMKWNPMNSLTSQLKAATQQISKSQRQQSQLRQQKEQQNKLIQQAVNKASNQEQALKMDMQNANPIIRNQRNFSGIQEQIQPIKKFLDSGIPQALSNPQNVPKSIRFLQQYARLQGYQPMGTVTDRPGRSYIGRYTVKQGNQTYVFPYPKNQVVSANSPNITQNFQYYANKAINQWNGFVEAQNKLVTFVQKVSTKQKRKQYVEQKIKGLTKATFAAMALSTLTYYYIQIPIEIFAKFNLNSYDGSYTSFINEYKVGTTVSRNPFLLNDLQGKQICTDLMKKDKPQTILNTIGSFLQNAMTPLNSKRIKDFARFITDKGYQAVNYFNAAGIPQQTYLKKMQSGIIDPNLKMKKFILPSPFQNTQILQILSKVSKQKDSDKKKIWQIQWGGQYLPCNDYVWNYQI